MSDNKKKLHAASAAYILGLEPAVKLSGPSRSTRAYIEVLEASKNLYDALQEGVQIEKIDRLLECKKYKARKFALRTGIKWPF